MTGELNVAKIGRKITAKTFLEWEAYEQMEPFGEKRADWRAATIVNMIYNMAVAQKDRLPVDKFLLKFVDSKVPVKKQSWEEKKAIGLAIATAYAAGSKRKTADSAEQARAMAEAVVKAYLKE